MLTASKNLKENLQGYLNGRQHPSYKVMWTIYLFYAFIMTFNWGTAGVKGMDIKQSALEAEMHRAARI